MAGNDLPRKTELSLLQMRHEVQSLDEPLRSKVQALLDMDWTLAEGSGGQEAMLRCSIAS